MTTTFALSKADYSRFCNATQAYLLKQRALGSKLYAFRVAVWFLIGLAGFTVARIYPDVPRAQGALLFAGILFALAFLCAMFLPLIADRMARSFIPGTSWSSLQSAEIVVEGITFRTIDGGSTLKYKWSALLGRSEDNDNYYLLKDVHYGFVLPKRALTPEEDAIVRREAREL